MARGLVAAAVVVCSSPAFALVGGAGVAPNTADSPWAGVGSLSVGTSVFTGTLIAPGYILTAAHVVRGVDLSTITFRLNAGGGATPGAGTKAGDYVVTVIKQEGDPVPPPDLNAPPILPPEIKVRDLLPTVYKLRTTSPLRATVKKGTNTYRFELK